MLDSPQPSLTNTWLVPSSSCGKAAVPENCALRNVEAAASLSHRKWLLSLSKKGLLSLGRSAQNEFPADLQDYLLLI